MKTSFMGKLNLLIHEGGFFLSPEINEVLVLIEEIREKLENIIKDKGMDNPQVMIASQILDAVLNEYYKLIKEKEQ